MIKVTVQAKETKAFLERLKRELEPKKADIPVRRAAFRVIPVAVEEMVKVIGVRPDGRRWNIEKPERQWQATQVQDAVWVVNNRSRVAGWLEFGTANAGTGFITPKRGKFMYIPLKRRAAIWRPGLKASGWVGPKGSRRFVFRDYILAKKVRGMKPKRYMVLVKDRSQAILLQEMKAFVKTAIEKARKK